MICFIHGNDAQYLVTLIGEMDTAAAQEAERSLQPLMGNMGKDVIIECESLEYIASSGLRLLLGILKQAESVGAKVTLRNVKEAIYSVLVYSGFVNLFEFE